MSSGIRFQNDLTSLGHIRVYNWNWTRLIRESYVQAGGAQFVGLPGNTYSVIYNLHRNGAWVTQSESLFVTQGGVIVILFSQIFGLGRTSSLRGLLFSSNEVSIDAKDAGQTAGAVLDEEDLKSYVAAGGDANDDISKFVAALKEKHLNERPDDKLEVPAE